MNSLLKDNVFNYTGSEQTYTVPVSGWYLLVTFGGAGGKGLNQGKYTTGSGGNGGTSFGIVYLKKNTTLYINVGGKGTDGVVGKHSTGGYNGGGIGAHDGQDDEVCGGGGGATHIAFAPGLLSSLSSQKDKIIIVAGGGGGGGTIAKGGNGGGNKGDDGEPNGDADYGKGGTQTSGFAFGKGQDGTDYSVSNQEVAGGGGGFYGGTSGVPTSASPYLGGAGGGSGYLSDFVVSGCGYIRTTRSDDSWDSEGYASIQLMMPDINNLYLSPNGTAEKPKSALYVGNDSDVAKRINKMYIGDNNNKAKLVWRNYE